MLFDWGQDVLAFFFYFRATFTRWVQLLYNKPRDRLCVNAVKSDSFLIRRGTRQGWPLSPLLFALAIEPLAALIRSIPAIVGLTIESLEEKVSLYADDMLIYLADPLSSLPAFLKIIPEFCRFFSFQVNWDKTLFFMLDQSVLCRESKSFHT